MEKKYIILSSGYSDSELKQQEFNLVQLREYIAKKGISSTELIIDFEMKKIYKLAEFVADYLK